MKTDFLLLALAAGHFVGDFVLQGAGLVERKAKNRWWVAIHVLIVAGVTWVLLGSGAAWIAILPVALAHFLIDVVKQKIGKDRNCAFGVFLGDQFLHIISIILIWLVIRYCTPAIPDSYWMALWGNQYNKGLVLISGFVLGIWGLGVALEYQMAPLAREVPADKRKGLSKGGKTIGLLERTLVLIFVLAGKPEGVAFVVAAKSVFRIGDLTDHNDRIHAEYIMIGTLRSFTYALLVAFILQWLLARMT